MITGIVLSNFKTYKGLNYIHLSKGEKFSGLIGVNGVGKSSILEAFDCIFNEKKWNKNIDANKADKSYVMPIFMLNEDFFAESDNDTQEFAKKLSDTIKNYLTADIPSNINQQRKAIWDSIKRQNLEVSENLIISFAYDENKEIHFGSMADIMDLLQPINEIETTNLSEEEIKIEQEKEKEERDEDLCKKLKSVYDFIANKITYIYIPKDIEPERFVRFETEEIQHLIGSNLVDVVKKYLDESQIKNISKGLKDFINDLSSILPNYKFKENKERQSNLKSIDIYDLIIDDFFSKRELFQENSGKDISLSHLSSGEKQQAITTLIHSCVSKYRENNENLIIAIDEPESALHISLCYEQFQKLYEISEICMQVLFSSHWYGFIPSITRGNVINIVVDKESKHTATVLDIFNYREEIKQGITVTQGQLPIDIELKGNNDLLQSIISSVISDNYYNWLICEGSSDKIYYDAYFANEIQNERLRIVPVGGLSALNKIFQYLNLAFEDLIGSIKGKIYLIADTDKELPNFSINQKENIKKYLLFKRIINDNCSQKETLLVDIDSRDSGKTDIEDALNGKVFFKALLNLLKERQKNFDFIDEQEKEEIPSYYAMNLTPSDYKSLDDFVSAAKGANKVLLAKKYVEELNQDTYKVPEWINKIKEFYKK